VFDEYLLKEQSGTGDGHLRSLAFLDEGGERDEEVGREVGEEVRLEGGFEGGREEVHAGAAEVVRFVEGSIAEDGDDVL
jgi:hypothetical protein